MENLNGVIIEESLADTSVLKDVKILSTEVEPVTEEHKTPWIQQWTMHNIEVNAEDVDRIAEKLSHSLDTEHNWYADFKNDKIHYVIFRDKVFKIDRTKEEEYKKATEYGVSIGIPEYQVDFSSNVKKWERV